ncbi:nickel pincer cofactor biosynthesis protein LarC [Halodesulfovibrio aestuarii]|uniref:nickel pincer cofactor biosynthesis protein LarC n=1 Tax=Halodesulfovibrio aestuarii TaxID=126333 RepID=UPI003521744F
MKILYYDCFAGISGDMNLAAMIDLGVDAEFLRSELGKLDLNSEFELEITKDSRSGIHGTRVEVHLRGEGHAHEHDHTHGQHKNSHHHEHTHHHHGKEGLKNSCAHTHKPHRNFTDIKSIIMKSGLDERVKETSLNIFRKVAEAEAKVHAKPVDEVHFHEVGATDSIVDIVGAAICYHNLGVEGVWARSVELGSGVVHCVHGVMPVPAPATSEILHNIPISVGGTTHEATTPTGAAIIASLTDRFIDSPVMKIQRTGYGIGHRSETRLPNVLRAYLAVVEQECSGKSEARLLQCNIDDMTGEMLGEAMDIFMEHGAMDAYFTPILMKKNRPGTLVSLLCGMDKEEYFKDLIFRHTTTLGIKSISVNKTALERSFERIEIPLGEVTLKHTHLNGVVIRSKPEFEDCKEIARRNGIPISDVYDAIHKHGK